MGAIGPWQILIVLVLAVVLLGRPGRISNIMGDVAKGITSFRKGLKDGTTDESKDASEEAIDVSPKKDKTS